jgi:hypothetical protein
LVVDSPEALEVSLDPVDLAQRSIEIHPERLADFES